MAKERDDRALQVAAARPSTYCNKFVHLWRTKAEEAKQRDIKQDESQLIQSAEMTWLGSAQHLVHNLTFLKSGNGVSFHNRVRPVSLVGMTAAARQVLGILSTDIMPLKNAMDSIIEKSEVEKYHFIKARLDSICDFTEQNNYFRNYLLDDANLATETLFALLYNSLDVSDAQQKESKPSLQNFISDRQRSRMQNRFFKLFRIKSKHELEADRHIFGSWLSKYFGVECTLVMVNNTLKSCDWLLDPNKFKLVQLKGMVWLRGASMIVNTQVQSLLQCSKCWTTIANNATYARLLHFTLTSIQQKLEHLDYSITKFSTADLGRDQDTIGAFRKAKRFCVIGWDEVSALLGEMRRRLPP